MKLRSCSSVPLCHAVPVLLCVIIIILHFLHMMINNFSSRYLRDQPKSRRELFLFTYIAIFGNLFFCVILYSLENGRKEETFHFTFSTHKIHFQNGASDHVVFQNMKKCMLNPFTPKSALNQNSRKIPNLIL